jgi:hypothetical protein
MNSDVSTLILGGLAILGYATGTIEFIKLRRFLKTGVRVKGRRIGYTTIRDQDNIEIELPILEYLDKNGRTVKGKLDSNPCSVARLCRVTTILWHPAEFIIVKILNLNMSEQRKANPDLSYFLT